jgi:plastocyanin
MRRLLTLAVLTAGLVLAMTGVAFAADVAIEDNGLSPTRVVVDVREAIVWTNNTDEPVSLVGEDPGWESGEIAPGATFSIEITRAGTYSYGSENGTRLRGQIVVQEGGANGSDDDDEADPEVVEQDDDDEAAEDDDEAVDPDDEALPQTGIDTMVPGILSLLLMAIGAGMLLVTHPERALRR